jgi:hypothetical protein
VVPDPVPELLTGSDPERARKATAVLEMNKLAVAEIRRAVAAG